MADNSVYITGAADGALSAALSGLPAWATENTTANIERILRKSFGKQISLLTQIAKAGGKGGSGGSGDPAKFSSELDKLIKHLTEGNKQSGKKQKNDKEQEASDKKRLLGVKDFNNKWQKLGYVLDKVAVIGDKILKGDQQYIKTYNDLYKSGINVLNGQNEGISGMKELNNVVTLTGLRLETLQEVAQKYSSAINAVGFNKFAKATGLATNNMKALGYSSQETADLIGAYADQQSNFTDMRRKSESALSEEVQVFAKQVTQTSLAMGISREKVLANSKALSESTDMSVIEAQYGADGAKNVRAALMGLNPEIASKFMGLVADSGTGLGVMNSTVMDMIKSTSTFSTEMIQMGKDLPTMDVKQFNAKWGNLVNSPAFAADMKRQQMLGLAGVEGAKGTQSLMASMKNYTNRVSEATDKQVAGATETKAVTSALATEQEKFAASMQAAFYPMESQIKLVTTGLELLNKAIYGVINHTSAEGRSWGGAGMVAAGAAAGAVGTYGAAKTAGNLFSKGGGATAGKVAGKAGGKLLGKLIPGIGLAFGIYDAIDRASKGDYVGAGMAGASGVASLFPGIGTAIAVGLDAGNMARDMNAKPTAINSPSASTIPAGDAAGSQASPSSTPVGAGIEKPPTGADINSLLVFQNDQMQQVVLKLSSLVASNNDIATYTKRLA